MHPPLSISTETARPFLPAKDFDLRHATGTSATQQGATMREVMSRLGHSTTSAAIRYQKAAADRDRALDDLVDRLRTPTNEGDSDPEPAEHPAAAAGFSRCARLTRQRQPTCENAESPATQRIHVSTPNGIRTRAATLRGTPKALTANRDGRQQARSRGSSERADVGAQGEPQRPRDIREMGRVHLPHSLGCPREPKPRVLRHETIALIAQIGNAPSCAELVRRARRRDDPTVTMMFTDLLGSTEL